LDPTDPQTPDTADTGPLPEAAPAPARTGWGWQWLLFGSLAALLAVVSFGAGMVSERVIFAGGGLLERAREAGGLATAHDPLPENAYPRYAETRDLIESEYLFRPEDADAAATFTATLEQGAMDGVAIAAATPAASFEEFQRNLDYGAVRGMTSTLEDDYTVFLAPVDHAPLAEELSGEYEGIGIWVEHPEGTFTVVAPIPGSPADEAGLRPGDVILEADGVELTGLPNDQALALIRGPAGSKVLLIIGRGDPQEPFEIEVERRAISIPTVINTPQADGRVAWIRVGIFGDKTTAQLDEALREAREQGVAGIVLDLRGNGGGWVTAAKEMIGRFVPKSRGPAMYEDSTLSEDDEMTAEPIIGGGEEVFDLPIVVLVDGGSASSSEIVAGALRDYGRATVVGEATFGKGLVQRVHDFEDGSSARITFARWLTPNREPIPEDGLQPDVAIAAPHPPDGTDPQLAMAVDIVLASAGLPAATPPAATPVAEGTPGATPVSGDDLPSATPVATPVR
jgi:carboxyl-terminal processing protease